MEKTTCKIGMIADSHIGLTHDSAWNQPVRFGGEETLFSRLRSWRALNQVDFIVHCGDVAEPSATREALALLSDLGCPVAAVRGNHDIMQPTRYHDWREGLIGHPQIQFGDSVFENQLCDVVLLNNKWLDSRGTPQWHWETSPVGSLSAEQLQWLDTVLGSRNDRPAIVVLHYPLDVVPPYRVPATFLEHNRTYARTLHEIFDRHPRVKVVSSGHFHATTEQRVSDRLHVTTAAFSEAPFQVRLLDVSATGIDLRTDALWQPGDPVRPDPTKRSLNGSGDVVRLEF